MKHQPDHQYQEDYPPIEERTTDQRLALYRPPQEWEVWAGPGSEETAEEEEHQTPAVVLFTFGYLSDYAEETLQSVVTWGSLIVDIRYDPTSRKPEWRQAALRKRLGERYLHIGALGNLTYRTKGMITLYRPEEGIAQVMDLLAGGQSVTLLCACRSHEQCHRALVASLIRERLPQIPLRHLPGPLEVPECRDAQDTGKIGD